MTDGRRTLSGPTMSGVGHELPLVKGGFRVGR